MIGKEQTADRCKASVAVHVTVVVPIGNREPDGSTQEVATGGLPLTVVAANVTCVDVPLVSWIVCGAGHVIAGGSSVGGGGGVGAVLLPHAAVSSAMATRR